MTSRRQFLVAAATANFLNAADLGSLMRNSKLASPAAIFATSPRMSCPHLAWSSIWTCSRRTSSTWRTRRRRTASTSVPHVKIHKSVDVAKRQIAQGAIGLTCATMAEAELMSGAGIKHVLWTKQPVSKNNITRAVALSKKDPTFMFVVDDPQVVDWVEEAAGAAEHAPQNCRLGFCRTEPSGNRERPAGGGPGAAK